MKRTLFIDADTVIYSSSAQQQKNKCLATDSGGTQKLWNSKTEFNEWAEANNIDKSEYTFEAVGELVGVPAFAFQSIRQKIDKIVDASGCDDFYVCIQGSGNFRNDYVTPHVEYKGHRVAKPLLFNECFEYTKKKWGDNCIISNGIETDDFVVIKGWESYNMGITQRDRNACPYVIAYVDKDIVANSRGWHMNYNKLENGVFWVDGMTQSRNFFTQVLIGDTADNIPGIVQLGDETKRKYGIRTKGCGKASAEKILGECVNEAHMARNVVEAYKDTWPHDWYARLRDNCFFLYLQRVEGEIFDVDKFFGQYGVIL